MNINVEYNKVLREVLNKGVFQPDPNRAGVQRLSIPDFNLNYDLNNGTPILTTKKINLKNVVGELLMFLRGDTNIKYLLDDNINIWNKDAYNYYLKYKKLQGGIPMSFEDFIDRIKNGKTKTSSSLYSLGDLGPVYGHIWRGKSIDVWDKTPKVDQFEELIGTMITNPLASDLIVSAWEPSSLEFMALKPCHFGFQVVTYPIYNGNGATNLTPADGSETTYGFKLVWSQRSVDTFLGLPYNILSYGILAEIIGVLTGFKAESIKGDLRNVHLYDNAVGAAHAQLDRHPLKYKVPKLILPVEKLEKIRDDFLNGQRLDFSTLTVEDFKFENEYKSFPSINVEMLAYNK